MLSPVACCIFLLYIPGSNEGCRRGRQIQEEKYGPGTPTTGDDLHGL